MKPLRLSSIILSVGLVASSTVKANTTFTDNPNETITITMDYDEFNYINGAQVAPYTSQTFAEGGTISFAGIYNYSWNSIPGVEGPWKVYLTEENNPALVSDILTYSFQQVYVYG